MQNLNPEVYNTSAGIALFYSICPNPIKENFCAIFLQRKKYSIMRIKIMYYKNKLAHLISLGKHSYYHVFLSSLLRGREKKRFAAIRMLF